MLCFLHSDAHVETWIPCQWIILRIPVVLQYHTIAPMLECDVDSTLINNSRMIDTLNPVNSFFSAWISAVILLFRLGSTEKELLRSLAHLTLLENCLACVLMILYFTHMPSIHLPPVSSRLFYCCFISPLIINNVKESLYLQFSISVLYWLIRFQIHCKLCSWWLLRTRY